MSAELATLFFISAKPLTILNVPYAPCNAPATAPATPSAPLAPAPAALPAAPPAALPAAPAPVAAPVAAEVAPDLNKLVAIGCTTDDTAVVPAFIHEFLIFSSRSCL